MDRRISARNSERLEVLNFTPKQPLQRRLLFMLGLVGAFVLGVAWAFATPVGSAADEPFHLTSIWCASGASESCVPDEQGDLSVPAPVGQVACFALDAGKSAECQRPSNAEWVPADMSDGYNPALFYNAMQLFVGPDVSSSVLFMRIANVVLAVGLWALAFLIAGQRTRIALVISWSILLTPVGLFFIPSANPSSWAIIGGGLFWAFLVTLLTRTDDQGKWRKHFALVGVIVAAVIALGSRTDTAFALGVSLIAVMSILMIQARNLSKRIGTFAAVAVTVLVVVVLNSRIGGLARVFLQDLEVPSNPANDQPNAVLKLLFEFPAFWAGLVGLQAPPWTQRTSASDAALDGYSYSGFTFGVGWTDVVMPASVGLILVALAGYVILHAFAGFDLGRVILALFLAGSPVGLIVFVRAGEGFSQGNIQPRYFFPLLLASFGILLSQSRMSFTRLQMGGMASVAILASALALRATLGRYVHGQSHSFTSLDTDLGWWWPGLLVGPNGLWIIGVGAASSIGLTVWLLAQDTETAKGNRATKLKRPSRSHSSRSE